MGEFLKGKVAVVTGSGRGIGRAIALRFAQEGAKVVVNNLSPDSSYRSAADTAREIRDQGGEAVAVFGDVSRMEVGRSLVETAVRQFGRLDILVNNAGVVQDSLLRDMTEEAWDKVIGASLKGAFVCGHYAAGVMMEQRSGCIINIASMAGVEGRPRGANYVATKAGLIGLTKTMAQELVLWNIRANCVCPLAKSDMSSTPVAERIGPEYPLPHYMSEKREVRPPESVAAFVTYLASDRAASVTGQLLWVQAGSIRVYGQPQPLHTLHTKDTVWDLEDLADVFPWTLGGAIAANSPPAAVRSRQGDT
ncbi:MAG: 3-oxoacyl-ACP reductase FabG [Chloroflexi bacterium]|nr:3-oxoacyl-ACP reductase FabG [Chloroflexota bacterium]